jgi:hypothetical protein
MIHRRHPEPVIPESAERLPATSRQEIPDKSAAQLSGMTLTV